MKRLCFILAMVIAVGCSKTPDPINYGTDMCQFCQMTIVTKTHAAQLVTDKGKQYKFDAIECMVRFLGTKQNLVPKSQLLIVNYNDPGKMIDAKKACFLISEEIGSPMGANLSGFISVEAAKQRVDSTTASYYDWNGIFQKLN